jgi:hypothetical protein
VKKTFLIGALAALFAVGAQASPTFYLQSQGVGFGFNQIDSDTFTLRIVGALDATGNWGPATALDNLGFKDLGFDPTGGTLTPGNWAYSPNELNANGCAGGDSGGVCFDAAPAFALSNDMLFTIDLTGGTLALGPTLFPHLKLRFVDAAGNKVGDLLSQSMPFIEVCPSCGPNPTGVLPEPGSVALAGLGLAALVLTRRRA